MAEQTKIAWCDHTMNFWIGCTEVSPACDNCYARKMAGFRGWAKWGDHPRQRTVDWRKPIAWNRNAKAAGERRFVFSNSLSDFFDNQVDPRWRQEAWEIIRACGSLTWLILTKRPQNIRKMLPPDWGHGYNNVWLGTTVEKQSYAKQRLPALLRVPAAAHYCSAEPLLEPLDLLPWLRQGLDWVIVGGESGSPHREMKMEWAQNLREQCASAGRAYFFKQVSAFAPKDSDIPAAMLVREFPG